MKLENLLPIVPDLTEEKLYNGIQKIIDLQSTPGYMLYPLFRDRMWTPEELMNEWELIQLKQSKLSRSRRDMVSILVSKVLYDMVNEKPKEKEAEKSEQTNEYTEFEEVKGE